MSNAIDVSSMFTLPDPATVSIQPVGSDYNIRNGYTHRVVDGDHLVWLSKGLTGAEKAMQSYLENGV